MKVQGIFTALTLVLTAALPLAAHADSQPNLNFNFDIPGVSVLSSNPNDNLNLASSTYGFAQTHTPTPNSFFDEWQFSVAQASDVSISLFDIEIPLTPGNAGAVGASPTSASAGNIKLLDNQFLTFSLFDQSGKLLGSAGENGTLSALNLVAGGLYTMTVSANVDGIFGSAYAGSMSVNSVAAVPLSDSMPLFGSALMLLAIRARAKINGKAAAV